jgi:hypothetical protein
MTTFFTLKRNVKLLPGQIVGFIRGRGYYARNPDKPAPKPGPAPLSPGEKALHLAKTFLGEVEAPFGSNRNRFGKWFGCDGVPWCNIFVSYCFLQASNVLLCKGFVGAGVSARGCTYVPTTEAWLKATGQWRDRSSTLKPGDIAIYNWDGGVPDHIGIVEKPYSDGSFDAIEGNTSVGNNSNGGEVMRRRRYRQNVDGFGRIA